MNPRFLLRAWWSSFWRAPARRRAAAGLGLGLLVAAPAAFAQAVPITVVSEVTPYSYASDGVTPGPATELVRMTLERAGIPAHLDVYPWARAYDMALNAPNVLIYLLVRTPEREPLFLWTAEVLPLKYHLYRLRNRPEVAVARLDDARRYAIGVIRDDVRHRYLVQQGFTMLTVAARREDNFQRLLRRQVDLLPMTDVDAADICRQFKAECPGLTRVVTLDALTLSAYLAYSRGTPNDLVVRTRAAFESLRAEGTVLRLLARVDPNVGAATPAATPSPPPAPALKP